MSKAFIYGGLDRGRSVLLGQDDSPRDQILSRSTDLSVNASEKSDRRSREGYVNGGLDRSGVSWTKS